MEIKILFSLSFLKAIISSLMTATIPNSIMNLETYLPEVRERPNLIPTKTMAYIDFNLFPIKTGLSPTDAQPIYFGQNLKYIPGSHYSKRLCSERPILDPGCDIEENGPLSYFFSPIISRCLPYKANNCIQPIFRSRQACFSLCSEIL